MTLIHVISIGFDFDVAFEWLVLAAPESHARVCELPPTPR